MLQMEYACRWYKSFVIRIFVLRNAYVSKLLIRIWRINFLKLFVISLVPLFYFTQGHIKLDRKE